MHWASRSGAVDLTCLLVEHGAEATVQDKQGMAPLHLASQGGAVETAHLLIKRGADVTARTKDGSTPFIRKTVT